MASVTGFVKNTANVFLADRRVRVYRRDTGYLLGEGYSNDGSGSEVDPHHASVVLKVPFTALPFTDYSPTPKTLTNTGVAVTEALAKFKASGSFTTGTIITTPSSTAFDFGSGDWDISVWIRPTSVSGTQVIIDRGAYSNFTPWVLMLVNAQVVLSCTATGSAWLVSFATGSIITVNTWHHIRANRSGNVFRVFVNGVLAGSQTVSGTLQTVSNTVAIGRTNNNFYPFLGYMDDLVVTKGVARSTADFSVPTRPMPLTGTSVPMDLGEFSIDVGSYTDPCTVIIYDADADSKNAIVYDRVTPI